MKRVAFSLAVCLALAGCSSFNLGNYVPSMPDFGSGSGGGYPLKLESDPPGADARTSVGPGCRTPCTVAIPPRQDFTVTFALPGYETQTLPVYLQRPPGFGVEPGSYPTFNPNPVIAQLEPGGAPPPPPPVSRKKPAKAKPAATARAAGAPKAAKAPKSGASSGGAPATTSGGAPAASDVPAAQRTIPGAQPTTPPASAWPGPAR